MKLRTPAAGHFALLMYAEWARRSSVVSETVHLPSSPELAAKRRTLAALGGEAQLRGAAK